MRYQLIPLTNEFKQRNMFIFGTYNTPDYKIKIDVSSIVRNHILGLVGVYINGILYKDNVKLIDSSVIIKNNLEMDKTTYEIALLFKSNVRNKLNTEFENKSIDNFNVDNYEITINEEIDCIGIAGVFINSVLYCTPNEIDLTNFMTKRKIKLINLLPSFDDDISLLIKK